MKRIAFILSISLTLIACNKYEDGPAFSLLTKKTRLARSWVIAETLFNDEPIQLNGNIMNSVYTFGKDNEYTVQGSGSQTSFNLIGTWQFVNDKEGLLVSIDGGGTTTYRISRLKNSSLWLKEDIGGSTLLYKYIAQ